MSIIGDVVFPGEVAGILLDYNNIKNEKCFSNVILYSDNLTPELAIFAITNNIKGIITFESSFATHGANIIRSYFYSYDNRLVWVTGVNKNNLLDFFGKTIEISTDGVCLGNHDHTTTNKQIYGLRPLKKRSIIEYNLSNDCFEICYWPHRRYDLLTFSLMRDGLKRNFNLLGDYNAKIRYRDDGSIWFCDVPTISTLSERARNINYASNILRQQIRLYEELYNKVSSTLSVKEQCDAIIDFFSIFLLFHDTYEDVLCDALSFFSRNISRKKAMIVINYLMTCKLDEWMLNNKVPLVKKKSLLSNEDIVPLPEFNIIEDIRDSSQKVESFFQRIGAFQFYLNNTNEINFYKDIDDPKKIKDMFIAKEWKFVMVKILFSRFSNTMKQLFDSHQIETILNHDYNYLIELQI